MTAPLCFLLAVVAGVLSDVAPEVSIASAVAALSLAILAAAPWRALLAILAVGCLCMTHGARAREAALSSSLAAALGPILDDRAAPPIWISGVLHDDAMVDPDGARLSIDVDRVAVDGVRSPWRSVRGRAQIGVGGMLAESAVSGWVRGRRVVMPIQAKRPQVWRNPGSPSERWQRLRRGVDLTGSVKSAALVVVTPGSVAAEWGARIRAHVRAALTDTVGAPRHSRPASPRPF